MTRHYTQLKEWQNNRHTQKGKPVFSASLLFYLRRSRCCWNRLVSFLKQRVSICWLRTLPKAFSSTIVSDGRYLSSRNSLPVRWRRPHISQLNYTQILLFGIKVTDGSVVNEKSAIGPFSAQIIFSYYRTVTKLHSHNWNVVYSYYSGLAENVFPVCRKVLVFTDSRSLYDTIGEVYIILPLKSLWARSKPYNRSSLYLVLALQGSMHERRGGSSYSAFLSAQNTTCS